MATLLMDLEVIGVLILGLAGVLVCYLSIIFLFCAAWTAVERIKDAIVKKRNKKLAEFYRKHPDLIGGRR